MKKLVVMLLLSIPALGAAYNLNEQVNRAAADALAKMQVQVHVKLAKPVYISDVMLRPMRGGKDTVIRTDYKVQTCTGRLSVQKTYVRVPASCIKVKNYTVSQIRLTFADGRQIQKSARAVIEQQKQTLILL